MLAGRLDSNGIGGGAKRIAAVLKDSRLSTLGCAATPNLHSACTRHTPMNTFPMARRLADNKIGGCYGEYNSTEGITALCEGLKGSAVTSLE